MTLSTKVTYSVEFTEQKTVRGATVPNSPTLGDTYTMATGTGLDQADLLYHEIGKSINASATYSLDLAAVLLDAYGTAITMAKVKGVLIENTNTTAGDIIEIGGNANAFLLFSDATDKHKIYPDSFALFVNKSLAGWAVTAATGDILDIAEIGGANAATVNIAIWGTSA